MGGNPQNVDVWDGGDVYMLRRDQIAAGKTIADYLPATVNDEFPPEWGLTGLLSGEDGFGEESAWDEGAYNAWGYGEIKKSFRNRKLTRKFKALERNAVTEYLESPGDTDDFVIDAKPARVYLGFEVRTDDGKVKRRITTVPATVMSGGRTDNEQDMASVEYTATIFPDSQKRRFYKQETGVASDPLSHTVTLGNPTAGTFTLTVAGQATAGIAYNATAAAVKSALEALSSVGAGNASVTGNAGGPYTVTVPGALTGSGSGLTGGNLTVVPS